MRKARLVYFVPPRDGPRWRTRQLCDLSTAPHVANHDKVFVLCDSPQYAHATGTATVPSTVLRFYADQRLRALDFRTSKDRLAGHDQSRQ